MLVYLASPYSSVENKEELMKDLFFIAHDFMRRNKGTTVVSPLFYHYSVNVVPGVDGDWNFWKNYSIDLLRSCNAMLINATEGWDKSIGLLQEIEFAKSIGLMITHVSPGMLTTIKRGRSISGWTDHGI